MELIIAGVSKRYGRDVWGLRDFSLRPADPPGAAVKQVSGMHAVGVLGIHRIPGEGHGASREDRGPGR
jgi:hypothetical protein